jgi:ribonuclease D
VTSDLIDSPAALAELSRRLASAGAIGLDTEGDGLHRYRARLCTIQIASPGAIDVVDAIALRERTLLAPVLGAEGPEKVLHDCAFDARLLRGEGIALGRVFDTAIAARFLGEVSTGLASLVAKCFGVEMEKDLQQADWGKRPLDEEEVAYLRDDVRHLVPLAEVMRARCVETGILDEVRAESEHAATPPPEGAGTPAWIRVKGAGDLRAGPQRAVLRELAALRERLAEEEDVPPFRVMPNALLVTLARKMPRDPSRLGSITRLARRASLSRAVLDAIERGAAAADVPPDELAILRPPAPPPEVREARKRRETALAAWRAKEAADRGVDVQVVLPGHCLRDLASRGARSIEELEEIPGIGACRVERYGPALVGVLSI